MFRSPTNSVSALLALALFPLTSAGQPPSTANQGAGCDKALATVVLIDDSQDIVPHQADALQRHRLVTPSQALRRALGQSRCFAILENDPIFWTLPGTAIPDFILRAGVGELATLERNLGERASNAVGRYLGSYLGARDEDVPLLRSLVARIDVLCPKSRRIGARFSVQRVSAENRSEKDSEPNATLMQDAFAGAAEELVSAAKVDARFCEPALGAKPSP